MPCRSCRLLTLQIPGPGCTTCITQNASHRAEVLPCAHPARAGCRWVQEGGPGKVWEKGLVAQSTPRATVSLSHQEPCHQPAHLSVQSWVHRPTLLLFLPCPAISAGGAPGLSLCRTERCTGASKDQMCLTPNFCLLPVPALLCASWAPLHIRACPMPQQGGRKNQPWMMLSKGVFQTKWDRIYRHKSN